MQALVIEFDLWKPARVALVRARLAGAHIEAMASSKVIDELGQAVRATPYERREAAVMFATSNFGSSEVPPVTLCMAQSWMAAVRMCLSNLSTSHVSSASVIADLPRRRGKPWFSARSTPMATQRVAMR
eukprot:CAMPEP_0197876192 /NCGR_PEP_ID=MMETSP1439-20131203/5237_1 /TAXON_ID=66791 /ORGANISM="Gonyaulax spinifera, Strain CCMP409" /LENGTH=128 /DNA_ID=CAMNT_0043495465 /DNA_START=260 /DNA_END=643 /DNA_ORIENTATION=-